MAPILTSLASIAKQFGVSSALQQVVAAVSEEYIFTGAQQSTVTVPSSTVAIKFAGVGGGGDSVLGSPGVGGGGGGGGAAKLSAYLISGAPHKGTTLYVGVGGPSDRRNTYVRTASHAGPIIFEVYQGSNGNSDGTGGAGGTSHPVYGGTGGSQGGVSGGRFVAGTGAPSTVDSAAGGGGAGGYGDSGPFTAGSPGGAGGSVTMNPGSYLQPIGHTPWTWGSSSSGGAGGVQPDPENGTPAPAGGATGGYGSPLAYYGTGGGGGAGIIINGVSYGGGGGGQGYTFPIPPTIGGPTGTLSQGAPGFAIVQLLVGTSLPLTALNGAQYTGTLSNINTDDSNYIAATNDDIDFDTGQTNPGSGMIIIAKWTSVVSDASSADYRIQTSNVSNFSSIVESSVTKASEDTSSFETIVFEPTQSFRYVRFDYVGGGRTARLYYLNVSNIS